MDHHYTGIRAYYRSKFALVAFTFDFAEQLADTAVTVNCLHPASLMNTRMVRQAWIPPLSSLSTGVKAVMHLAVGPTGAAVTGRYFKGCRDAKAHPRLTILPSIDIACGDRRDPPTVSLEQEPAMTIVLPRVVQLVGKPLGRSRISR